MGYNMHQTESQFRIPVANKAPALVALKALCAGHDRFHWVANHLVREAESLKEAIDALGWKARTDEQADGPGNIVAIRFELEKAGDEDEFFACLAPFVDAGCFIEMAGEDGDRWRWVFDGKACRRVTPTVVWE